MADGVWTARMTHVLGRLPGAKAVAQAHARLYRRTNGRFGGWWFRAPVLVLETVGRVTGTVRATPLIYVYLGTTPVVVAANGGSDRTPNWWLNLRAAGQATVHLKGQRRRVRPRELAGEQREAALERFHRVYPSLRWYRQYTSRPFPVIALHELPTHDSAASSMDAGPLLDEAHGLEQEDSPYRRCGAAQVGADEPEGP
jgi:deazaflavin-dependent oxidoreductase (nitroreductase family)